MQGTSYSFPSDNVLEISKITHAKACSIRMLLALLLTTSYVTRVRSLRGNLQPRTFRIDRAIAMSVLQGRGLRFSHEDLTIETYE